MAQRQRFISSGSRRQAASDFIYDHECDPCKFEGTVAEGTSFCNDCREFLCDECQRVHRNSRATRGHDVVKGTALAKLQIKGPAEDFEFCLKHPGKVVDFYCVSHDNVFCADCRVITHGNCREVKSVSAASTGIKSSKEAKKFKEQIDSINARIGALRNERKRSIAEIDKQKQKCLQEITSFRDGINKLLDKLENEIKHGVNSVVTKGTNNLQDDLSRLDTLQTSMGRDEKNLEAANSTGSDDKIFIAMKQAGLQELMAPLDSVDQRQHIVKLDFEPHDLLQEILSSLPSLGSLETNLSERQPSTLPPGLRDRSLKKEGEYVVQQTDDGEVCIITGSVFLPSGESLLCDRDNAKVKLLNTDFTIKASRKLTSGPSDVAMVTKDEVVVSLPDEKKLQFVTVPGLKPGRKVEIGRLFEGLAVHKEQIFATCHDGPGNGEILVLTKDGAIQRRIGRTGDGSYMFTRPIAIAVDAPGEKIYVSDWVQHSVTCLTREGGPVYHCVLGEAMYPYSLLVDSEGGVLVCSEDSSTASLQFLTPDGKPHRILITWPRKQWFPFTFCYRSSDRTLLVGMHKNNNIMVYKFE